MGRKEYLFAYGTLRKEFMVKWKKKVASELLYIGKAKIGGALYDLGRYPGAVKEKGKHEIIGDVFWLNDPGKILKILDRYEGYLEKAAEDSEFVRKRNRVRMNSGKNVNAWIYWYNLDPQHKTRIKHKDYLNYLKTKI